MRLLTIGARRGRIGTLPELAGAIGEGAAFLAQGAGYSYIRARSGLMGPRLMQDAGFGASMDRCKWEGFSAIAGDLILIVETELRPRGSGTAEFWRRLYRDVLAAQATPAHRAGTGWPDRIAEFDLALDAHRALPPRGIEALCEHGAEVLLEFAPVEDRIRRFDREMVVNNVTFRVIDHIDALRRRADWQALATAINLAAKQPS
ncbi:MAG TPA: esterase [Thermohalobaculum sp.]|nr:esterase [Thermohalobaculum sp.]